MPARSEGRTQPDDPALKLWVVLSRAEEAVAAHDRHSTASHGLTSGEFAVLEALFHKGPLRLTEVREKILVSSGGITYLIDRLEQRELVARRPCPGDRRATHAVLTDEGEALMEEIFPEHRRCLQRALSGLTEEEQRAASRLLKKLGRRAAELSPCDAG